MVAYRDSVPADPDASSKKMPSGLIYDLTERKATSRSTQNGSRFRLACLQGLQPESDSERTRHSINVLVSECLPGEYVH